MDKEKLFEQKEIYSWKSFDEFISVANQNCTWLVLRNFEYLPNNFFGNDTDVDILCENISLFVKTMKLRKRSWGIGAYEATIDGKVVPFDVRFLGDGYYDKLWQYKMLKNRIFTTENVPRMNNEDYFYSLLYHSKIQKISVKEEYKKRFYELSLILGIENYKIDSILDDEFIAGLLNKFMRENNYTFVKPLDTEIPQNSTFYDYLDCYVKNDAVKIPKKVIIGKFIPDFLLKLIPRSIKNILHKVI
jgi:hypothetical protein